MANEIRIYIYEPISEGNTYLFEVHDRFQFKEIERKVYFNKHDGLYIMYKGKKYFESEFIYN